MNERLKEFAEQTSVTMSNVYACYEREIERFAKLLATEEPQNFPKWEGMKPIDGELRIKAGIKLSHKDPYCMEGVDMNRGKMYSPLEALQIFADLVRQDEREANAKLCEKVHDDYINDRNNDGYDWPDGHNCAEAIRARTE